MEAHVMKLENNCVIVDEEYFNEIKKQSEFNQERINEIAEERFLEYVKESGIELSYEVNGIPYIFHHDLLSELNYEERGYPESVSDTLSLLQLNPLPKSGCVKSRSCISLYIIVLPATHTIYLKRIWERYFIVSPKVRMMEVIGTPTRKH